MKQIYQIHKSSFTYNLKYLFYKSILNYIFYGSWLLLFILFKFAVIGNVYLSGPIAHVLVIFSIIVCPLITSIMQLKYLLNGSASLKMLLWLISIYYIFLIAITFIYAMYIGAN